MANHTSHLMPYPIVNARFSLPLSFRVAAGTPTDPTTPDTEFSTDGGATYTDCAEEITTGGGNGGGYLTLTGAETNTRMLLIAAKSANCVTTPAILHPRTLAIVGSGTLSAGSSGGGTLGTLLAYDVTGCFLRTTGGTGGGGTGGTNNQARRILTYNTTTGAFTVSAWETTPDATTTYDVLLPEGVTLGMLRTLNPTTSGRTLDVASTGEAGLDFTNRLDTTGILPSVAAGAAGGLFIAGSNAATTINGLTTGVFSCTTLTASGAVAFQSTFAITGTTTFNALTVTNALTVSGATTFTGAVTGTNASNDLRVNGVVPGLAGGVLVAGSNAATTFATLTSTGAFSVGGVSSVAQTGDVYAKLPSNFVHLAIDVSGNLTGSIATVAGDVIGNVSGKVLGGGAGVITAVGVNANVAQWAQVSVSLDSNNEPRTGTVNHVAGTVSTFDALLTTLASAHGAGSWADVTVSDKTGFKLASDGTDAISIESGLNLPQALAIIGASACGTLSGASTATIVIAGAGVATTRITATTDVFGNRSAVVLTPPA